MRTFQLYLFKCSLPFAHSHLQHAQRTEKLTLVLFRRKSLALFKMEQHVLLLLKFVFSFNISYVSPSKLDLYQFCTYLHNAVLTVLTFTGRVTRENI